MAQFGTTWISNCHDLWNFFEDHNWPQKVIVTRQTFHELLVLLPPDSRYPLSCQYPEGNAESINFYLSKIVTEPPKERPEVLDTTKVSRDTPHVCPQADANSPTPSGRSVHRR